jgi:hypothetical protein
MSVTALIQIKIAPCEGNCARASLPDSIAPIVPSHIIGLLTGAA